MWFGGMNLTKLQNCDQNIALLAFRIPAKTADPTSDWNIFTYVSIDRACLQKGSLACWNLLPHVVKQTRLSEWRVKWG